MASSKKLTTAQLLFDCASTMGMNPQWLTKRLFTVETKNGIEHVHAAKSSLNSHLSNSLARDKYVTRTILDQHGLPNIPYAHAETQAEAARFLKLHKRIIAKPTRGSGAYDINLIANTRQLATLNIKKYILEKYIVGKEFRYLVLNGKVIAVYQSEYGSSVDVLRDLTCTTYHEADWDQQLVKLSQQIVDIFKLRFGTVDYLVEGDGTAHVLEVNTAPDLKWFHNPTSGPVTDVASLFLQAMLDEPSQAPAVA